MFRHANSQFSERVREYFARYGPTVCHSIVLESEKPGGLKRLMSRLRIPEGLSNQSQLDALDEYIQEHGVNAFLEKLVLSLQSENQQLNRQRPMSRSIEPRPGDEQPLHPVTPPPAPPQYYAPPPQYAPPPNVKPSEEAGWAWPVAPAPYQPDSAAPKAKPQSKPQPTQAPQSAPPQSAAPAPQLAQDLAVFDANGRYIGPERRSGVERRSGEDRRNRLQAIEGNKRFGPDRRQTIRRADDMSKDPRELGMH